MTQATIRPLDGRHFAWTGYAVGTVLVLSLLTELSQLLQATAPTGGIQWRFAFMGFAISALPQVLVGWLVLTATATLLRHSRTARALAVLQALFGFLLLMGLGFFVLDFLQIRVNVTPQALPFLDGAAIRSGLLGTLGGICTLGIAAGSWKAGSHPSGSRRPRSEPDPRQKLVPR